MDPCLLTDRALQHRRQLDRGINCSLAIARALQSPNARVWSTGGQYLSPAPSCCRSPLAADPGFLRRKPWQSGQKCRGVANPRQGLACRKHLTKARACVARRDVKQWNSAAAAVEHVTRGPGLKTSRTEYVDSFGTGMFAGRGTAAPHFPMRCETCLHHPPPLAPSSRHGSLVLPLDRALRHKDRFNRTWVCSRTIAGVGGALARSVHGFALNVSSSHIRQPVLAADTVLCTSPHSGWKQAHSETFKARSRNAKRRWFERHRASETLGDGFQHSSVCRMI